MTFQLIHYDSTRLIRIHITWSGSADACTCDGYLCSPRAMCHKSWGLKDTPTILGTPRCQKKTSYKTNRRKNRVLKSKAIYGP